MGNWREVRIGDFLHRIKQPIRLQDDENYKLVTVRMHHNGVVLRELKKGKLIGSNMYRVKSGQFILSGIDARHGAFGVIPDDLDGAVVTNDFWYFDVDESVVSRDFFLWLTTTPLFLDACIKSSEGTTNRRRLQGDKFFNFEFHFPEISEQKMLAERFNAVDLTYANMKGEFEQQSEYFKLLRQAMLQEAVEGKLTEKWRMQHPVVKGDPQHDAAALLAQIKTEKERLVQNGKIRKEKPLPPIADSDKPFDLPDGWVWCRLGEIIRITSSRRIFESEYVESGVPFYRSKEIGELSRAGVTVSNYFISNKRYQELKNSDDFPSNGDLLLTSVGSIGNTWIVDDREFYFKDGNITQLVQSQYLNVYYLQKFIGSFLFFDSVRDTVSGTVYNALTIIKIKQLAFPLPPLSEQHAIVTRVDSLMAAVDELEKQVAERKEQAQLLMQTVLREAFDGN